MNLALAGVRRLVAALVRSQRCYWDQSGDESPHSKEAPWLWFLGAGFAAALCRLSGFSRTVRFLFLLRLCRTLLLFRLRLRARRRCTFYRTRIATHLRFLANSRSLRLWPLLLRRRHALATWLRLTYRSRRSLGRCCFRCTSPTVHSSLLVLLTPLLLFGTPLVTFHARITPRLNRLRVTYSRPARRSLLLLRTFTTTLVSHL